MTGKTISGAAQTADPNAPKTAQKAPKAKAKKAPALDAGLLAQLAGEVAEYEGSGNFADLISRLEDSHKLKITETPKGSGRFVASMAKLKGKPSVSPKAALILWANRARREVARAAA